MRIFAFQDELALATALGGQPSVLELFESGLDTCDIAKMQWRREARVLRDLEIERCARRGLPHPYQFWSSAA